MAFLLLRTDQDHEVSALGVFSLEQGVAPAVTRAWDAMLVDITLYDEHLELEEQSRVEHEYWDGFDEVREPEHVNHTVTCRDLEYRVMHVEER
jgi:hypothetical protein